MHNSRPRLSMCFIVYNKEGEQVYSWLPSAAACTITVGLNGPDGRSKHWQALKRVVTARIRCIIMGTYLGGANVRDVILTDEEYRAAIRAVKYLGNHKSHRGLLKHYAWHAWAALSKYVTHTEILQDSELFALKDFCNRLHWLGRAVVDDMVEHNLMLALELLSDLRQAELS